MKQVLFILTIILCLSIKASAQIENINDYKSLISYYDKLKSASSVVLVWGRFRSFGKYPNTHKFTCIEKLNKSVYSKINTSVELDLFSDSLITYFLPLKQRVNLNLNYHDGDVIKLRIRIFKECKMVDGNHFF